MVGQYIFLVSCKTAALHIAVLLYIAVLQPPGPHISSQSPQPYSLSSICHDDHSAVFDFVFRNRPILSPP